MKTIKHFPIVLFTLFSFTLAAQVSMKVGVGPQVSDVTAILNSMDAYLGLNADFRFVFESDKKLQFEIGLAYNQKGHRYNYRSFNNEVNINYRYLSSFIELPLQLNYFFKAPSNGIYVLLSLRPNRLIRHTVNYKELDASGNNTGVTNNRTTRIQEPSRFNIISRGGIGFEITHKSSKHYFVELYGETQTLGESVSLGPITRRHGFGALLGARF